MKFSKLVGIWGELEGISSRNRMMEILAGLLKETDEDEVEEVVNLSLGRLGVLYERLDFSLAEKQVVKALAVASDMSGEEVQRRYKSLGDLGKVAEEILASDKGEQISVKEVYEQLVIIAKDSGEGSQDRKIQGLAVMLKKMSASEAKFATRIVMGKLRLGFSDKTVLDAVSFMEKGDKSVKEMLELSYQIRPEIGYLVRQVKKVGALRLSGGVEMKLGIPIMPMLCQRLKSTEEMVKKMGEVAVEPKFDGTRVQIHFKRGKDGFVRTFTRNLEETSLMFPELFKIGDHVEADELVLDSEAVGFDPKSGKMLPFQMTITRKRKHGIEEQAKSVPLKFFVFDVMYMNGKSLIEKTYEERRKILKGIIKGRDLLVADDYWVTNDPGKIRETHEKLLKEGFEGVVVKKEDSRYVPGRTGWRWVKMKEVEEAAGKLSDTLDCVVMGYYSGRGKRVGFGLGAFLVGVRNKDKIVTIAKVGTGLKDEQFKEIKKRLDKLVSREKPKVYGEVNKMLVPDAWVEPEVVVEIAADEITKSPNHSAGVALRFPRLIKFREDKSWKQATSVEEVKEIKVG